MIISNQNLIKLRAEKLSFPDDSSFKLPEKVLQFGTGVLLRGLPDYFIDKANRNNVFNGRIVIVKSTNNGDIKDFEDQDSLYTICVRGLENGKPVEENIISSAISRVLSADKDWEKILETGRQEDLKVIVSNTTEIGIQLIREPINSGVPKSFPAKLLAVLHARYKSIGNSASADIVIIATELIPDNGKKLESIVHQLAEFNNLEEDFLLWLNTHVFFCNSLVDRIVPGRPDAEALLKLESELGYKDNLLIMAEPYRLWAIEGNDRVSDLLDLERADDGVLVKPDIEIYRELKVRLLNGSHTLACGMAFLSGMNTVNTAMSNERIRDYTWQVMHQEIIPAIPYAVTTEEANKFAASVIDRFANPYIEHLWINITFQYTMKMKVRILPVLLNYYKLYSKVPQHIAFGFAAYLLFMRTERKEGDKYFGKYGGLNYPITDEKAGYFHEKSELDPSAYVMAALSDIGLWETDLHSLPGFIEAVVKNYLDISINGIMPPVPSTN